MLTEFKLSTFIYRETGENEEDNIIMPAAQFNCTLCNEKNNDFNILNIKNDNEILQITCYHCKKSFNVIFNKKLNKWFLINNNAIQKVIDSINTIETELEKQKDIIENIKSFIDKLKSDIGLL